MVTTYCVSGAVALRAGTKAPFISETQYEDIINDAEATINAEIRTDPIAAGTYAGLADSKKLIYRQATSALAAGDLINFDDSNYSTASVTNIMNKNWTLYTNAIRILKEKYTTDFVGT